MQPRHFVLIKIRP